MPTEKSLSRNLLLFTVTWFIFVHWGLELAVIGVFYSITGHIKSQTSFQYLTKVWAISGLRILMIFILTSAVGLRFSSLYQGSLGKRGLILGIVLLVPFIIIEVICVGVSSYKLQILREFNFHLKLAGENKPLALLGLTSEYIYYLIEILSVNTLYLGTSKFVGARRAIIFPMVFWGFAHILNLIIEMNALQALGLALYMSSVALVIYYVAYHTGSLRVPIIAWMLLMIA
ncbi:Hypothetical protein TES1_1281 [Thermococcus paralvinellae]|uniref:CPBP family intramembrane metalloprotease n=2 Tax=Thermococcus paralvinellae TaxID=582419 RepID=W0I3K9_9EURY|nr:Hypothetical protein TES1_1281 [Thermococcus paralvinellae]